jgi:hypothetical protein
MADVYINLKNEDGSVERLLCSRGLEFAEGKLDGIIYRPGLSSAYIVDGDDNKIGSAFRWNDTEPNESFWETY